MGISPQLHPPKNRECFWKRLVLSGNKELHFFRLFFQETGIPIVYFFSEKPELGIIATKFHWKNGKLESGLKLIKISGNEKREFFEADPCV